jgi:hypothetical protein
MSEYQYQQVLNELSHELNKQDKIDSINMKIKKIDESIKEMSELNKSILTYLNNMFKLKSDLINLEIKIHVDEI